MRASCAMGVLAVLEEPHRSLCWVAPVSEDSELATEDPLALDYLSQQVGLWLFPTFTSRSDRAQAFAMVLFGLSLAERAIQAYGTPATDAQRRWFFERWERFWALATIESRGGELPRGHGDAMRGIRGARAAWRAGSGPLPLDFSLISRQQELGNLGAYLSPLRRAKLLLDGTLRPSAAALEIIDAFWDEADNRHRGRYEEYALLALDPKRSKIERCHANLTLAKLGENCRLTSLNERKRKPQQRRLHEALFANARDASTLAMSQLVEAAVRDKVTSAEEIIDGALAGRFGAVAHELHAALETARSFGAVVHVLLRAFDRVYDAVAAEGWSASSARVAGQALDEAALRELRATSRQLLVAPEARRLRTLPLHGAACLRLAAELPDAAAEEALEALLRYHDAVQKERRRGEGWIRLEGGRLVLLATSYTTQADAWRFPTYKFPAVRSLLVDTGRLGARAAKAAP
jgi:hypothetical protein